MIQTTPGNQEAVEAWDGVLFDRFVQYRDAVVAGLTLHGDRALEIDPPRTGERVLDIGCGFGDMTQQLAALVGPTGEAVGVDASERFVEASREEAAAAGVPNAGFFAADVQAGDLGGPYDAAYSRCGTMFFANPVVALRNVAAALVPGGRLCMVVWRRKLDNDWVHRAEAIAERYLTHPDQTDEPTCGPGPFSMANADTVCDVLHHAGFTDMTLHRTDRVMRLGRDVASATEVVMALGPAGELIRVNGAAAEPLRPRIEAEIREAFADWLTPEGVMARSSTWVVTAVRA
jgi:SAM-dependent methyltransferase